MGRQGAEEAEVGESWVYGEGRSAVEERVRGKQGC